MHRLGLFVVELRFRCLCHGGWARQAHGFPAAARSWSLVSGCGGVLVDESAPGWASLDRVGRTNRSNVFARRGSLSERAVLVLVVLSDVLLEQDPHLTFVPDDGPVEQFVTDASHASLRKAFPRGAPGGVMIASAPMPVNTSLKLRVYCRRRRGSRTGPYGRGASVDSLPAGLSTALWGWW